MIGQLAIDVPETWRNRISQALERIVAVAQPRRVVLFGSVARGEFGPESDLDFLVIVKGPVHRRQTAQRIYHNLHGVDAAVDVVVVTEEDVELFGDKNGLILRPALREGREVYGAPE